GGKQRVQVGDRGAESEGGLRVHQDVAARMPSAGEARAGGDDVRAGPVQVARAARAVDRRRLALDVRHRRPGLGGGVVLELPHVDVVESRRLRTAREVHERGETEAVPELVERDGHEIELAAPRVAVEAVVPAEAGEAARVPEVDLEGGADVLGIETGARA